MLDELKARLQAEVERLNHEISFVLPKEIEKARPRRSARKLGVQGRTRAPAVRPGARAPSAPAPVQTVGRVRQRHPERPRGIRLARDGAGRGDESEGDLRPDARGVHRG